jgi:hypothetical protein
MMVVCSKCGKSTANLSQHLKLCGRRVYPCHGCTALFTTKPSLRRHMSFKVSSLFRRYYIFIVLLYYHTIPCFSHSLQYYHTITCFPHSLQTCKGIPKKGDALRQSFESHELKMGQIQRELDSHREKYETVVKELGREEIQMQKEVSESIIWQLQQELILQKKTSGAWIMQLQQEVCNNRETSETTIGQLQQELQQELHLQKERSQAKVSHLSQELRVERVRFESRVKELGEEVQSVHLQVSSFT